MTLKKKWSLLSFVFAQFCLLTSYSYASESRDLQTEYSKIYCQGKQLDFAGDIKSWEQLATVTQQLRRDLYDGDDFVVSSLQEQLQGVLEAVIPNSGFYYYLQALQHKWFAAGPASIFEKDWMKKCDESEKKVFDYYKRGAEKGYPRAKNAYYYRIFYQLDRNKWPHLEQGLAGVLLDAEKASDVEARFWVNKYIIAVKSKAKGPPV